MNKATLKNILFVFYLSLCLTIATTLVYYQLNYKHFKHYTIKKQRLITPIFLNVLGAEVTEEEKAIVKQINPIGVMLYKLNFKSYEQVKKLTTDLKNIFPNRKLYIAIDQEGGKIDRIEQVMQDRYLKQPRYYGKIAEKNLEKAKKILYQDSKKTAKTMKDLNIDINFAPMVDLIHKKSDGKKVDNSWSATNKRSYSRDQKIVIELAKTFIKGMKAHQIMTTIKHIPGLGRSYSDTHDNQKVIIDAKLSILEKTDFAVFKELSTEADFAMVGHATYSAIDNKPATLSKKTIDIIKNTIGFKGILISDALNMKAVNKIENIGIKTLEAGIDIIIPNYISYHMATNVVNNIDKKILIKFNNKIKKLGLLEK